MTDLDDLKAVEDLCYNLTMAEAMKRAELEVAQLNVPDPQDFDESD
jgi:hypothetical protein